VPDGLFVVSREHILRMTSSRMRTKTNDGLVCTSTDSEIWCDNAGRRTALDCRASEQSRPASSFRQAGSASSASQYVNVLVMRKLVLSIVGATNSPVRVTGRVRFDGEHMNDHGP
jgi:hypothetical protein